MSKLPTVFDIKQEFYKLQELLERDEFVVDEETGEVLEDNTELLKELASEIEATRDEKLENIEYLKRDFKLKQQALKDEAKRLSERAKSFELAQKKLLDLQDFLLAGEKLKTDKFTFYYGSSEALEIEDESAVPPDFITFIPKIDKTNLKKAVKSGGVAVDGIKIVKNIGLRVR